MDRCADSKSSEKIKAYKILSKMGYIFVAVFDLNGCWIILSNAKENFTRRNQ
jgi:hypothetical protein